MFLAVLSSAITGGIAGTPEHLQSPSCPLLPSGRCCCRGDAFLLRQPEPHYHPWDTPISPLGSPWAAQVMVVPCGITGLPCYLIPSSPQLSEQFAPHKHPGAGPQCWPQERGAHIEPGSTGPALPRGSGMHWELQCLPSTPAINSVCQSKHCRRERPCHYSQKCLHLNTGIVGAECTLGLSLALCVQ